MTSVCRAVQAVCTHRPSSLRNAALCLLAFAAPLSPKCVQATSAARPGLWLTTLEPIWRDIRAWPQSDYGQLGADAAAWSHVLRGLSVFQFSEKYAVHGESRELAALIALFRKSNVQIAVQGIALIASRQCGLGVESFGTKDETVIAVRRLESLGAKVDYIVFDEPLYYGHFFRGGRKSIGCRLPISKIVDEVLEREGSLRAEAPGVRIGDVEPFGLQDVATDDWTVGYQEWLSLYRERTGRNWDFAQADIVWSRPNWRDQFLPALKAIQDAGIAWGAMYTASAPAYSNLDWAAQISADYRLLEGELAVRPPQAVIASWTDYPRAILPETEAATLTGAALGYLLYREKAAK